MMHIINVIPLIKIPFPNPQILSYFFNEKLSKGALVRISLRKKQINAIVYSSENLEKKKLDIKKGASFKLKPIEKTISKKPVLTSQQLKLLLWFSEYYFSSLGLVARLFVPQNLISAKKPREDYQMPIINKQTLKLTPETKKDVFLPFNNLKSITIEDADSSKYISWGRQPYYDTRKIALKLARIFKAKITLKTNMPSVETHYWATKKKYKLQISSFPGRAPRSGAGKFQVSNKLIDMREEIKKGNYSILSEELQKKLKQNKKSILYIPRRGTTTCILCRDCGYVIKCPHCDAPLVYHQVTSYPPASPRLSFDGRGKLQVTSYLLCHHCGNKEKPPTLCPICKGYRIKYFGAGTQKVEAEIQKLLPKTKVFRLDSDAAKTPTEQQKIINNFEKEKNAVLIGTQMLLEKNIKPINLVGIVSIETILNLPDYRSSERVFRTLNQLRLISKKGFLVQAYNPENIAIQSAVDNNRKKFYDEEIKIRKALCYPPFSQIIKLSFEHRNPQKAEEEAKILFEKFKTRVKQLAISNKQLAILGPVPAFIPRIASKYRWNIILKLKVKSSAFAEASADKHQLKVKLLMIVPLTWKIEVDPESLL